MPTAAYANSHWTQGKGNVGDRLKSSSGSSSGSSSSAWSANTGLSSLSSSSSTRSRTKRPVVVHPPTGFVADPPRRYRDYGRFWADEDLVTSNLAEEINKSMGPQASPTALPQPTNVSTRSSLVPENLTSRKSVHTHSSGDRRVIEKTAASSEPRDDCLVSPQSNSQDIDSESSGSSAYHELSESDDDLLSHLSHGSKIWRGPLLTTFHLLSTAICLYVWLFWYYEESSKFSTLTSCVRIDRRGELSHQQANEAWGLSTLWAVFIDHAAIGNVSALVMRRVFLGVVVGQCLVDVLCLVYYWNDITWRLRYWQSLMPALRESLHESLLDYLGPDCIPLRPGTGRIRLWWRCHCGERLAQDFPQSMLASAVRDRDILIYHRYEARIEFASGANKRCHPQSASPAQSSAAHNTRREHRKAVNRAPVRDNYSSREGTSSSTSKPSTQRSENLESSVTIYTSDDSASATPKWLLYCLPYPLDPGNAYIHRHWRVEDGCICEPKTLAAMKKKYAADRGFAVRHLLWRDITNIVLSRFTLRRIATTTYNTWHSDTDGEDDDDSVNHATNSFSSNAGILAEKIAFEDSKWPPPQGYPVRHDWIPVPTSPRPERIQKDLLHLWQTHSIKQPERKSMDPRSMVRNTYAIVIQPVLEALDTIPLIFRLAWTRFARFRGLPEVQQEADTPDLENANQENPPLDPIDDTPPQTSLTASSPSHAPNHSIFLCTEAPLKINKKLLAPPRGKCYGWGIIMKEGVRAPPYAEWIFAVLMTLAMLGILPILGFCLFKLIQKGFYDQFITLAVTVGFAALMWACLSGVNATHEALGSG